MLRNLYLHHTLDVWFEREVKPRLGGEALVRYCMILGFERREDAQRVGGAGQADGAVRTEAARGLGSLCSSAKAGQRVGRGRARSIFWGSRRLATDAARTCDVVQDAEQGPEAIHSNGLRMVSAPPASTGRGPARSAQEIAPVLQLLRSDNHRSLPSGSRHAGLAQDGCDRSQHASHVGAVQPIVGTLPDQARGLSCGLGGVATRHISPDGVNLTMWRSRPDLISGGVVVDFTT